MFLGRKYVCEKSNLIKFNFRSEARRKEPCWQFGRLHAAELIPSTILVHRGKLSWIPACLKMPETPLQFGRPHGAIHYDTIPSCVNPPAAVMMTFPVRRGEFANFWLQSWWMFLTWSNWQESWRCSPPQNHVSEELMQNGIFFPGHEFDIKT